MAQNNYRLEMEKLSSNEGFMLVECCIVLVAISVMTLLVIPSQPGKNSGCEWKKDHNRTGRWKTC